MKESTIFLGVTITNLNMDYILKKYYALKLYLKDFTRDENFFISKAKKGEDNMIIKGSIDIKNAILDWCCNEEEANKFFKEFPEGFKFNFKYAKFYNIETI